MEQQVPYFLRDFICAATASSISNCAVHPLETIKVRQMLKKGKSASTSAVFRSIVRQEGVKALYKGLNAAVARAVVSGGGRLSGYNGLKLQAQKFGVLNTNGQKSALDLPVRATLAMIAACTAQLAAAPLDLIRTRQGAYKGSLESTPGFFQITREVVARDGFTGLFAGSSALMGRAITFNIGQLLTYDKAREASSELLRLNTDSTLVHFTAAMVAGFASTMSSAPAENVKTVMQVRPDLNFGQSCRHIFKNGGMLAFWRGWVPLYVKLAPHTMIIFMTMEQLRSVLGVAPVD